MNDGTRPHQHKTIQSAIYGALPVGQCQMEHRFEKINRIADLYWEDRKIVFEVQCSPITPEEIAARNHDYAKVECEVVWILHDGRYNQNLISKAEAFLEDRLVYFATDDGVVYDQPAIQRVGKRCHRFPKFKVYIEQPAALPFLPEDTPEVLATRAQNTPFCFVGDALYALSLHPTKPLLKSIGKARRHAEVLCSTGNMPKLFTKQELLEGLSWEAEFENL